MAGGLRRMLVPKSVLYYVKLMGQLTHIMLIGYNWVVLF